MVDVVFMSVCGLVDEGERNYRYVGKVAGFVALCVWVFIVYESAETERMVQVHKF